MILKNASLLPLTIWKLYITTLDTLNSSLSYSGTSSANGGKVRVARRWDSLVNTINFFPGDIGIVRIYNQAMDSSQANTSFQEYRTTYGI